MGKRDFRTLCLLKNTYESLPPREELLNISITHKMHSQEGIVMIAPTSLNKNLSYFQEIEPIKPIEPTRRVLS